MEIPCKECLILPICRHKPLGTMLDCQLITKYHRYYLKGMSTSSLEYARTVRSHRKKVRDVVRPFNWALDEKGFLLAGSQVSRLMKIPKEGVV